MNSPNVPPWCPAVITAGCLHGWQTVVQHAVGDSGRCAVLPPLPGALQCHYCWMRPRLTNRRWSNHSSFGSLSSLWMAAAALRYSCRIKKLTCAHRHTQLAGTVSNSQTNVFILGWWTLCWKYQTEKSYETNITDFLNPDAIQKDYKLVLTDYRYSRSLSLNEEFIVTTHCQTTHSYHLNTSCPFIFIAHHLVSTFKTTTSNSKLYHWCHLQHQNSFILANIIFYGMVTTCRKNKDTQINDEKKEYCTVFNKLLYSFLSRLFILFGFFLDANVIISAYLLFFLSCHTAIHSAFADIYIYLSIFCSP